MRKGLDEEELPCALSPIIGPATGTGAFVVLVPRNAHKYRRDDDDDDDGGEEDGSRITKPTNEHRKIGTGGVRVFEFAFASEFEFEHDRANRKETVSCFLPVSLFTCNPLALRLFYSCHGGISRQKARNGTERSAAQPSD